MGNINKSFLFMQSVGSFINLLYQQHRILYRSHFPPYFSRFFDDFLITYVIIRNSLRFIIVSHPLSFNYDFVIFISISKLPLFIKPGVFDFLNSKIVPGRPSADHMALEPQLSSVRNVQIILDPLFLSGIYETRARPKQLCNHRQRAVSFVENGWSNLLEQTRRELNLFRRF